MRARWLGKDTGKGLGAENSGSGTRTVEYGSTGGWSEESSRGDFEQQATMTGAGGNC